MSNLKLLTSGTCLAMFAFVAFGQDTPAPPANPITQSERGIYGLISGEVVKAAEKMPEENYAFKPTPEVRTFGQLVGHVADAQYNFCANAGGDAPMMKGIEKSKTTKADLVAALKESISYCNKTFAAMTDAEGAKMTKLMSFKLAKLSILSINTAHMDEHYGNMVTYLRIKNIVPPSSESAPPKSSN